MFCSLPYGTQHRLLSFVVAQTWLMTLAIEFHLAPRAYTVQTAGSLLCMPWLLSVYPAIRILLATEDWILIHRESWRCCHHPLPITTVHIIHIHNIIPCLMTTTQKTQTSDHKNSTKELCTWRCFRAIFALAIIQRRRSLQRRQPSWAATLSLPISSWYTGRNGSNLERNCRSSPPKWN